jgi:chlorophyllide a oxygenase
VAHTLQRLAELEMAVNDKLLEQKKTYRPVSAPNIMSPDQGVSSTCDEDLRASNSTADFSRRKYLDVSGPVGSYPAKFKDFWYPVAFSDDIDSRTMVSHCF